MDAVKYITEKTRMCSSVGKCIFCPLHKLKNGTAIPCYESVNNNPKEAVAIVEQWSKGHPVMTNGAKFEEVFGRTYMSLPSFVGEWLEQEYKELKENDMDVIKFFKEKGRMCEAIHQCQECPISSDNNKYGLNCVIFAEKHPEEAVSIVEQWSEKHQIATNWQKFREVFGTAINPMTATVAWWSAEYKEPKGE